MQDAKKNSEIKKIYLEIEELISESVSFGAESSSVGSLERNILKGLLGIGLHLLILAISTRHEYLENQTNPKFGDRLKNKGLQTRVYQSIFGELPIVHRKYHVVDQGVYYPLDESLSLPSCKLSYVLQDWVSRGSTELDYRESVSMVNEILGLGLNGVQSKYHINDLGQQVNIFYDNQAIEPVIPSAYLCLEWDGKGVPIIKELTDASTTSVLTRLKKGQKRGVKKTATVSVVSSFSPRPRSKDRIIGGLFKSPLTPLKLLDEEKTATTSALNLSHSTSNNWHQDIHRRAFLGSQEVAINYGINRAKKRMKDQDIPIVVLVDGGVGLEGTILASFDKEEMRSQLKYIILDIVHVAEYIWKAANAILGENSSLRTEWVRGVLSDILDSKINTVIEDLKENLAKTNLSKSAKKLLNKTITYFRNHQHKMDYKTYLQKGMPVSTALVESSCGHLVKDRMERSGMRWSLEGAQNMMDARAVKKNGDWGLFMDFVIQQNQEKYRRKVA